MTRPTERRRPTATGGRPPEPRTRRRSGLSGGDRGKRSAPTGEQLLWGLFELARHWQEYMPRLLKERRLAAYKGAVRVARHLRVLALAAVEDAPAGELDALDRVARSILNSVSSQDLHRLWRRTRILGRPLLLPEAWPQPQTYVPRTDVVFGETGERFGRADLGRRLVELVVEPALRQELDARQLATLFLEGRYPAGKAPDEPPLPQDRSGETVASFDIQPPPFQWLEHFLAENGVIDAKLSHARLATGITRVLNAHRVDSDAERHAAARAIVRATCIAAGLTKERARSLFEAEERADRRRVHGTRRRGDKGALSPQP